MCGFLLRYLARLGRGFRLYLPQLTNVEWVFHLNSGGEKFIVLVEECAKRLLYQPTRTNPISRVIET